MMTKEQAAAYVYAQAVCAMAEIESMKAANATRERQGYALEYDEGAFFEITNKYPINHNAICQIFGEAV